MEYQKNVYTFIIPVTLGLPGAAPIVIPKSDAVKLSGPFETNRSQGIGRRQGKFNRRIAMRRQRAIS